MTHVPAIAAVTGGSAGIGQAICEDLLAKGYEVISLSLGKPQISHPRFHTMEVDLTDRHASAQAMAHLTQGFEVTTLVHNAGVIRPALIADVTLDQLDELVTLHLGCAIQLVQAVLPQMRSAQFGRIVLMSSRAALGAVTRSAYSATKAGMLGMMRTWALELGPHGITVNAVAPGPIRTDMFYEVIPKDSELEQALAAAIPVRRLGDPVDVAHAVGFLTSPQSSFITGQVLYVCGGSSVGSLTL